MEMEPRPTRAAPQRFLISNRHAYRLEVTGRARKVAPVMEEREVSLPHPDAGTWDLSWATEGGLAVQMVDWVIMSHMENGEFAEAAEMMTFCRHTMRRWMERLVGEEVRPPQAERKPEDMRWMIRRVLRTVYLLNELEERVMGEDVQDDRMPCRANGLIPVLSLRYRLGHGCVPNVCAGPVAPYSVLERWTRRRTNGSAVAPYTTVDGRTGWGDGDRRAAMEIQGFAGSRILLDDEETDEDLEERANAWTGWQTPLEAAWVGDRLCDLMVLEGRWERGEFLARRVRFPVLFVRLEEYSTHSWETTSGWWARALAQWRKLAEWIEFGFEGCETYMQMPEGMSDYPMVFHKL